MPEPQSRAPPSAPTEPRSFRLGNASSSRLHPYHPHHPALGRSWNRAPSGPRAAQMNNPIARSPLQQSFPASTDAESAPNSPAIEEASSRRARPLEQTRRPRGESRSSSLPVWKAASGPQEAEGSNLHRADSRRARTRPPSRETSPDSLGNGDKPRASVKHLTCFWWWAKGACRHKEKDCLYSHHDTGHYTAAPRQVFPGEPAKAGRSLERALNKLAIADANRSTSSLPSLAPPRPMSSTSNSRPETPFIDPSHSTPPSPVGLGLSADADHSQIIRLQSENEFFRSLVDQAQHEKRALIDTIESLQTDKSILASKLDEMDAERSNLLGERNGLLVEHSHLLEERNLLLEERIVLQATIKKLQFGSTNSLGMPLRSASAGLPSQNPWGTIGSRRVTLMPTGPPPGLQQQDVGSGMTSTMNDPVQASSSSSLNPAAIPYGFRGKGRGGVDDFDVDVALFSKSTVVEGHNFKQVLRPSL